MIASKPRHNARYPRGLVLIALWFAALTLPVGAGATTYYVGPNGSDDNPGFPPAPFRTVQRGVNAAGLGDMVVVFGGDYDEIVETRNDGAEDHLIVLGAIGNVTIRSLKIDHSYIRISGFKFYGHKENLGSYIEVGPDSDHCEIVNCEFGPGTGCIVETNIDSDTRTIISPGAGFASAGFATGDVFRLDLLNSEGHSDCTLTIQAVSDNALTTIEDLPDAGMCSAHFSIMVRCIDFQSRGERPEDGPESCRVIGNKFHNTFFNQVQVRGTGHHIEGNEFTNTNGFDCLRVWGRDHVIRGNHFHDVNAVFEDLHTDIIQTFGTEPSYDILFERNFVADCECQIAMLSEKCSDIRDWTFKNNVFFNIRGAANVCIPGVSFVNNTFYKATWNLGHVIDVKMRDPSFSTGNTCRIRNNFFIDCGVKDNSVVNSRGWYRRDAEISGFDADHNYVAGAYPAYPGKTGLTEMNGVNGGDPLFVDPSNLLGPDGIPFTADDGLRLGTLSPAIGAGEDGADIGAYPFEECELGIAEAVPE